MEQRTTAAEGNTATSWPKNVRIEKKSQVRDKAVQAKLWDLLVQAQSLIEILTPIRQNPDHHDFVKRLEHQDVLTFVMYEADEIIGYTMTTNNLELSPWLNCKFYQHFCPQLFAQKLIWCNLTMAIRLDKQKGGYLKSLLAETYHFGTTEGRIMIVDYSWRLLGAESFPEHIIAFAEKEKRRPWDFYIYEKQQFVVFSNPESRIEQDELAALRLGKPYLAK